MSRETERDWMGDAVCRDEDPELFFPVGKRETKPSKEQVAWAKSVCARCPVQEICLDYVNRHAIEFGVFGGTDEWERREARRERRVKRVKHAVAV